jgi:glycosyltransferase involved in cell wall biosynthesis
MKRVVHDHYLDGQPMEPRGSQSLISILILTHNEEANIKACLESVAWSDDVLVFDSFSTDKTPEIAAACGARVMKHSFENFGAQREAARQLGAYKHPWVLSLDADERPDDELVAELKAIVAGPQDGPGAYRMRRKDHFQGRWIKHSTLYPSWFVRFYRWDRVRYEARSVHEYPTVDGSVGELKGHLLHYSFNKGLADWWIKHALYASLESQEGLKSLSQPLDYAGLISPADPVRNRRALKNLAARMPFRPFLRFAYGYLARGGFLDGRPGLDYCLMLAAYEHMIVLNMRERRRADSEPC